MTVSQSVDIASQNLTSNVVVDMTEQQGHKTMGKSSYTRRQKPGERKIRENKRTNLYFPGGNFTPADWKAKEEARYAAIASVRAVQHQNKDGEAAN